MAVTTKRFLLLMDVHPEHHYSLRRISAIERALKGKYDYKILSNLPFLDDAEREQYHALRGHQRAEFFARRDLRAINRSFMEALLQHSFDILVLFTIHEYKHYLLPDTLQELRQMGKFVVGVFGDEETPSNFHDYRFWLPLFDRVVAYTADAVRKLNRIHDNVLHLPESVDMHDAQKVMVDETSSAGDCVFIGGANRVRKTIVEHLIKNKIDISIYGNRQWFRYRKIRSAYKGFVPNKEYDRVMASYGISIGMMEDGNGLVHCNAKLFDAARNGMFVITTYYRPFIDDYGLTEGQDIVMYRSHQDLVEKVQYYLAHPEERYLIAENLQRIIREKFDYDNLYRALFDQLVESCEQAHISIDALGQPITYVVPYSGKQTFQTLNNDPVIYISKNISKPSEDIYSYRDFKSQFQHIVPTDYLVITHPSVKYLSSINQYVQFLEKNFNFERVVFRSYSSDRAYFKLNRLFDVPSIIWKKKNMGKVVLAAKPHQRILWDWSKTYKTLQIPLYFNYVPRNRKYDFIFGYLYRTMVFARRALLRFHRILPL